MNDANNTEDTQKPRRRASDHQSVEGVLPSEARSRWSSVFNGIGLAFILTVCVAIGSYTGRVEANVEDIAEHDKKFDIVVARLEAGDLERLSLLKSLEKSNAIQELRDQQQIKSDGRFEGMFNESNKKLDDVIRGVNDNKIQIINLNKTTFVTDNTGVYLAMR